MNISSLHTHPYTCQPSHNNREPHAFRDHLMQLKDTHASHAFFKYSLTPHALSKKSNLFFILSTQARCSGCLKSWIQGTCGRLWSNPLIVESFRIMGPVTPKLGQF